MILSAVSPVNQSRYDSLVSQIASAQSAGQPATVRYLKRQLALIESPNTVPPMGVPLSIKAAAGLTPESRFLMPVAAPVAAMPTPTGTGFGGLPIPLLLGGAALLFFMMYGKKRGRK